LIRTSIRAKRRSKTDRTEQLQIDLPFEAHLAVELYASATNTSVSEVLASAVLEYAGYSDTRLTTDAARK
jgi:hypothetical protein